ncbi:hypothetical protein HN51_021810, partial [Arachis hypogaea]
GLATYPFNYFCILFVGHLWHAERARAAAAGFEKGINRDFEPEQVIKIEKNRSFTTTDEGFLESGIHFLGNMSRSNNKNISIDIVDAQSKYGFLGWNLWQQPIGFVVFLISSLAECERLPFDYST